jgi:hypothetical protein
MINDKLGNLNSPCMRALTNGTIPLFFFLKEFKMSLKPKTIEPIPDETARVAQAAFPDGTTYMIRRDELGTMRSMTC